MSRHTDELKDQIEHILRWEHASHWRPRDFARLSELVYSHTQELVDAQQLEVFWHSSIVHSPEFLNSLARFVDYTDWDDFCRRNAYGIVEVDEETALTHPPMWEIPIRWVILICWFSVIASVLVAILLIWKR